MHINSRKYFILRASLITERMVLQRLNHYEEIHDLKI